MCSRWGRWDMERAPAHPLQLWPIEPFAHPDLWHPEAAVAGAVCSMKVGSWGCFAQGCSVRSSSACGQVVGQAAGTGGGRSVGICPRGSCRCGGVQEAMNRSGLGGRGMEKLVGPARTCSPGLHHFTWAPCAKKVLDFQRREWSRGGLSLLVTIKISGCVAFSDTGKGHPNLIPRVLC